MIKQEFLSTKTKTILFCKKLKSKFFITKIMLFLIIFLEKQQILVKKHKKHINFMYKIL